MKIHSLLLSIALTLTLIGCGDKEEQVKKNIWPTKDGVYLSKDNDGKIDVISVLSSEKKDSSLNIQIGKNNFKLKPLKDKKSYDVKLGKEDAVITLKDNFFIIKTKSIILEFEKTDRKFHEVSAQARIDAMGKAMEGVGKELHKLNDAFEKRAEEANKVLEDF